jgi:transposase-like protein
MKKSKFTKTQSVERRRKEIRYFSEEARRAIVNEIDEGNISKAEASRKYAVSQTAIYNWIQAYSPHYRVPLVKVVEHESDSQRNKKLEAELAQVYETLGRVQTEHMLLEKVVKLASDELGIDLKKNFASKPLSLSGTIAKQG